jgi:hypothetical protein
MWSDRLMDRKLLKKIFRDIWRIDRVAYPKVRVLTVAHDTDRSYRHAGKWYAPMIDTIEDDLRELNVPCVSVARVISEIKGDKAYGRVLSPEGGFARALIGKRLKGLLRRGAYPFSHQERAVWRDVLQATGARIALAIQPSREMCSACHELGVWVADVQHGVIGQAHPWYGAAFRRDDPPEQLPSAFLVWDQESADVIQSWAGPSGPEVHVVGNRWLSRFIRSAPDDGLVQDALTRFSAASPQGDAKPTILVTLSWGTVDIPNGFITDALCKVIQQTSSQYRWMLRLHPNQVNGFATHEGDRFPGFFERELKGHADWRAATEAPLPAVLRMTDLHICWNSSSCIEAAMLGIRSALLDPELREGGQWSDYYSVYKAMGMVTLVDDAEQDIKAWISNSLRLPKLPPTQQRDDECYARLLNEMARGAKPVLA